jgi:hypothetical protein
MKRKRGIIPAQSLWRTLAEVLGHTDQTGRPDPTLVWKRYGHLYPGSTREAEAALDRH